jgi:hypothetical protein
MSKPKKLKPLVFADPNLPCDTVIELLGGYVAVAEMTGANKNAAWNWTVQRTFPADTFVLMSRALAELGYEAPPSLWRQREGATA